MATISLVGIAWLASACGAEQQSLRTSGQNKSERIQNNLDGVTATSMQWQMTCDSITPEADANFQNVAGLGSLQMPDNGPRKLAIRFSGNTCQPPIPERGRDIVLAFELSDQMAELDAVGTDGSCARSRLLREWAVQSESAGLDALDGDVRVSIILYSRLVLAKVAGFHSTFETAVERLLATQKKADLDSMICLGRGAVDLDQLVPQVELLKSNFGRNDATKEFIMIGAAQDPNGEAPESLLALRKAGWLVSGVNFDQATLSWADQFKDGLGQSTWSSLNLNPELFEERLSSAIKNQLAWQFSSRPLRRPAANWTSYPVDLNGPWVSQPIQALDSGDNWGLEVQLQANDRFGVISEVFSSFLVW